MLRRRSLDQRDHALVAVAAAQLAQGRRVGGTHRDSRRLGARDEVAGTRVVAIDGEVQ